MPVRTRKKQQRPPPYELFFHPLLIDLSRELVEEIQFAYICSKYGHAGQTRADGTRYFDHPKAAAWIYINELKGRDPRVIIDLLLHDMVEDAYLLSSYRIGRNFGKDVADDVRALTKLPRGKETTERYMKRIIEQGANAIVAKLCDRLHNLRTMGSMSKEHRRRQIAETRRFHLRMLIPALQASGEPLNKLDRPLKTKISEALKMHTT